MPNSIFESPVGNSSIILQKNLEQEQKIIEKLTEIEAAEAAKRLAIEQKLQSKIEDIRKQGSDKERAQLADLNAAYVAEREARVKAEEALENAKLTAKKQAADTAVTYELNRVKQMTVAERRIYSQQIQDTLKDEIQSVEKKAAAQKQEEEELNKIIRSRSRSVTKEQKEEAKARREALKVEQESTQNQLGDLYSKSAKITKQQKLTAGEALSDRDAGKSARESIKDKSMQDLVKARSDATAKINRLEADWAKQNEKRQAKINLLRATGHDAEADHLQAEMEAERKAWEAKSGYIAAEAELEKANQDIRLKSTALVEEKADEALKKLDENIQTMYGNQAKYSALLQGTDLDWRKAVWGAYSSIGYSGAVSTKNVVKKMENLLDQGVAYNLELRAFLAETSENIAATFDATNGTLLRIIRLQQQDTTAARLGMEATLTKLFNSMFEDTNYLAANVSESVTNAILDASMTMSKDMSLQFEYSLQKWLGALYSLGMSTEGVTKIAQAINYLGTGNVDALNQNESMQTLLAMSAGRVAGGKSYADMLTQGIDASDTNKLLKSMIEYLAQIAESQTNMVTKSAYANLFGMSITDLSSFASLTESEINSLFSSNTSYNDLVDETQSQLRQILTRKSVVQLVDTAIDNALTGVGVTFGSTPGLYGTWRALDLLEKTVGEIKIPSVLAAGFGIGDLDLLNVAQTAVVGIGLVGSLLGALGSLFSGGATSLNAWDFEEHTKRGGSLTLLAAGESSNSTSLSAQLASVSGSAEDFETVTFEQGEQKGKEEYDKIVSEDLEEEKGIDTGIYEALVDKDEDIITVTQDIRAILAEAFGGGGSGLGGSEAPVEQPSSGGGSGGGRGSSNSPSTPGDSSNPYESAQGAVNSSNNPSSGSTNNGSSDKIYELLEKSIISGNDTLISVIQSLTDVIDDKLNQERVFYTSIVSDSALPPAVSDKVSDLQSQVTVGSTVTGSTQENTTPNNTATSVTTTPNGQPLSGSGMSQNAETQALMEAMIVKAVETAIRNISGFSGNDGLPVYVTNLHNWNGGY